MTVALRHLACLPARTAAAALAGPPLVLAVALGLTRHHLRTRKTHR